MKCKNKRRLMLIILLIITIAVFCMLLNFCKTETNTKTINGEIENAKIPEIDFDSNFWYHENGYSLQYWGIELDRYIPDSKIIGDVNQDGCVSQIDRYYIYSAITGKKELSNQAKINADVNGDGRINASDGECINNFYWYEDNDSKSKGNITVPKHFIIPVGTSIKLKVIEFSNYQFGDLKWTFSEVEDLRVGNNEVNSWYGSNGVKLQWNESASCIENEEFSINQNMELKLKKVCKTCIQAWNNASYTSEEAEDLLYIEGIGTRSTSLAIAVDEKMDYSTIKGDVNCDGYITYYDYVLIQRYTINQQRNEISDQGFKNADVDNQNGVQAADANEILKYLQGETSKITMPLYNQLTKNRTIKLKALNESGYAATEVTWRSTNTAVASINSGQVTIKGIGHAQIIVTKGNHSDVFCIEGIEAKQVQYTVNHYKQDLDDSYKDTDALKETETFYTTSGENMQVATKNYTGFETPTNQTVIIREDGLTVVNYYYKRKKFTLTLNSSDHVSVSNNQTGTGSLYYETSVTLTASPTTGYKFNKWTFNPSINGVNLQNSRITFKMPANNVSVTPSVAPIQYQVRYNGNNATNNISMPNSTHTYNQSSTLSSNKFEREYNITYYPNYDNQSASTKSYKYKFIGWTKEANGSTIISNAYNLAFSENDVVDVYAKWEPDSENNTPYVPTRTGYKFAGWYTNSSCTDGYQKTGANGEFTTPPTSTMTVYAKWIAEQYNVSFDYNGATGNKETNSKTVTYNSSYGILPIPERKYAINYNTKDGNNPTNAPKEAKYNFDGWYKQKDSFSEKVEASTTVDTAEAHTLHAKWSGGNITLPTPTRNGYTFEGWYKDNSLSQLAGHAGDDYTPGESVTLYAKWNPITYAIKYDGNKETSGSMSNSTGIKYDQNFKLSKNEYKREYTVTYHYNYNGAPEDTSKTACYIFNGWARSAEEAKVFDDQDTVSNLTTQDNQIVTLYANWTATSVKYKPKRAGYDFLGWYKSSGGSERVDSADSVGQITPSSNIEVYAKWKAKNDTKYKVQFYLQNNDDIDPSDGEDRRTWPSEPYKEIIREGITDTKAMIEQNDKSPIIDEETGHTYVFETNPNGYENVLSGTITGHFGDGDTVESDDVQINSSDNGTLVLKLYFRQVYTVTYTDGMDGEVFADQVTKNLELGTITPHFKGPYGIPPKIPGYTFEGWYSSVEPHDQISEYVCNDVVYTARWVPDKNTPYTIAYYYQQDDGTYSEEPSLTDTTRVGENGTMVSVKDSDKEPNPEYRKGEGRKYILDESQANLFTHEIYVKKIGEEEYEYLTLKVYFKQQYTISYRKGDHGTFEEQTTSGLDYNSDTPPFTNEKTCDIGYSFAGWEPNFESKVTRSVDYVAKWQANSYTLTFNANGGTVSPDKITQDYETEINMPTPTRTYTVKYETNQGDPMDNKVFDYHFDGWYTEEGEKREYTTMPPYDETLYARWSSVAYELPTPTRAGYNFLGWYTNENLEDGKLESTYVPTQDITLYAKWEARADTKYTINHYKQGFNEDYPEELKEVEEKYGTTDTKVTPEFKNYTGFTPKDTTQEITIKGDGTAEINYYYTRNKYYYVLGSHEYVSTEGSTPSGEYYYEAPITLKATVDNVHTFVQWISSNTNLIENQTLAETTINMPAGNISMIPEAKISDFTLTFDGNGGTPEKESITAQYDTEVTLPGASRSHKVTFETNGGNICEAQTINYDFLGWYTGKETGNKVEYTKIPDHNQTLYARWSREAITLPNSAKSGYILEGWYTDKDLTNKVEGTTYEITEDTTLYAKWVANSYTLTFDANGGTIEVDGENVTQTKIEATYNDEITMPTPTRSYTIKYETNGGSSCKDTVFNYNFDGWYTDITDGVKAEYKTMPPYNETLYAMWSDEGISLPTPTRAHYKLEGWYSDEDLTHKVNSSSYLPIDDVTLYAKWIQNSYTLTFDANNGKATKTKITKYYNEEIELPDASRKHTVSFDTIKGTSYKDVVVEFEFLGWYTDKENGTKVEYTNMPDHDETLYARWSDESITLPTPSRGNYDFIGWYTEKEYENKITTSTYTPTKDITLYARWVAKDSILQSIYVKTEPYKINYLEEQEFNPDGMEIVAVYSNSKKKYITNYTYEPTDKLKLDTEEINITYTENGITKTTSLPITVVDKSKAVLNYDIRKPTKKNVTATVEASQEIVDYIADHYEEWQKSEDGKSVYRVFTENGKDDITVTLEDGGEYQFDVEVGNIDRTPLKAEVTYDYDEEDDEVTVEVEFNHPIDDVETQLPDGWELSEDGKKLTKKFKENTSEKLTVTDELGNETTIDINVTQVGSNKGNNNNNSNDDGNNEGNGSNSIDDLWGSGSFGKKDPTLSDKLIPNTGKTIIITLCIAIVLLTILAVYQYKKYKDIK